MFAGAAHLRSGDHTTAFGSDYAVTKVSVFIVTLNEAETIGATVQSVADFDEVIVVDSGSTDDTVAIARREGARVVHHEWQGFSQQKAFALGLCSNEWCLNLDGDEVVPPVLLGELKGLIASNQWDLIRLRIEDIFMGAPMHPKSRKRAITRCFRKSLVQYPTDRRVHENIQGKGRLVTTEQTLTHWGYNDLGIYVAKHIKYARLRAEDKFLAGKRFNGLKLMLIFPITFIKVYLLRGLILSGWRGLVQSVVESFYAFLKEAYLWIIERKSAGPDS